MTDFMPVRQGKQPKRAILHFIYFIWLTNELGKNTDNLL